MGIVSMYLLSRSLSRSLSLSLSRSRSRSMGRVWGDGLMDCLCGWVDGCCRWKLWRLGGEGEKE